VSIPVAIVGRINDPDTAEFILAAGDADMVCLGRPLVADPAFVAKAQSGHPEDIIPCISCNDGCIGRTHVHRRLGCVVNPRTGFEAETVFKPAETPKRVLVVGGGPGGMEAAAVAAERGHRVILCEKADQLGGQLLLGGIPSFKDEINTYCSFLVQRLKKRWVEVRTGTEVTPHLVANLQPDVVVFATGGVPCCPSFPGADRDEVITFDAALKSPDRVGKRVVVVGGGETGCETALFLARGDPKRDVTIVEMMDGILTTAEKANRMMLEKLLPAAGIKVLTNCTVQSVGGKGVEVVHDGSPAVLPADSVVCALGTQPQGAELKDALIEQGVEVHAIGDCIAPRKIWYATHEGAEIARSL
jgi:NADPH-dependent 2,4-dienoyl-CoA reductase/sulfur reductase-like enzyme